MYRLLLVDDESMILNSMMDNDWRSMGIEEVYQASNGLEAVKLLHAFPIDVVVTDIRMPGMNGLELCKHIREHFSRTRTILLSGYSEFDYARQALRQGAVDYLLKPIKDEELMDKVKGTIETLVRDWEKAESVESAMKTMRLNLPLLRSNLLNERLARTGDAAEWAETMVLYGIPFRLGDTIAMFAVRTEYWFTESKEQELSLYEYAVSNMADEIMGRTCDIWSCRETHGYMFYLVKPKEQDSLANDDDAFGAELMQAAHQLQQNVKHYLKGNISILISGRGSFPDDLPQMYRSALSELYKLPISETQVIMKLAGQTTFGKTESIQSLYTPPTVIQLLEAGRWQDVRVKAVEILTEMTAKRLDTGEHLMEVVSTLLQAFMYSAHLRGESFADIAGDEWKLADRLGVFKRVDDIRSWTFRIVDILEAGSRRENEEAHHQLINRINRFIETHIAEEVSLQAISDEVGMHPVYLSSLYKKETGENISDFILRFRMDKAGILLRTTDIKIYDLAGQLGFLTPPYFSKLFKKHYKLTPQEYRDRYRAGLRS
jgi:two-component system response regulator YesN